MALVCPRCGRPVGTDAPTSAACDACGEPLVDFERAFDPARLEVVDLGEHTGAPPRRPAAVHAADPVVEPPLAFAPPASALSPEPTFQLDPAWEAERRAQQEAARHPSPPPRSGPGPAGLIVAILLIAVVTAGLVYVAR